MTALSTAEAALRRMPDDPAVPVTLTGAEAVAVVVELDRLRKIERAARVAVAAGEVVYDSYSMPEEPFEALQHALDAGAAAPPEREYGDRPALVTCPTCGSAQPHLHPSRELCSNPFHRPVPTTVNEWRREAARWADLIDTLNLSGTGAAKRLVEEIRREVRESGSNGRRA